MIGVFMSATPAISKPNKTIQLEQSQVQCLRTAYEEGEKIELYGDTWGQTIASIAYQESHCNGSTWQTSGIVIGDLNHRGKPRSLGVMQIQLPTSREVGKRFPHIFKDRYGDRQPTDEELTIDLLIDTSFNIKIGVHYYAYLLEYRGGDWEKTILSYNRGIGHNISDINDYVKKVKHWRKNVIFPFLKGNYQIIEKN